MQRNMEKKGAVCYTDNCKNGCSCALNEAICGLSKRVESLTSTVGGVTEVMRNVGVEALSPQTGCMCSSVQQVAMHAPGGVLTEEQFRVLNKCMKEGKKGDFATSSFFFSLEALCPGDDAFSSFLIGYARVIGDEEFTTWLIASKTLRVLYSFVGESPTPERVEKMHDRLHKQVFKKMT